MKKSYYFLNNKNGRLSPQLVKVQRIGTVGCLARIRPYQTAPPRLRNHRGGQSAQSVGRKSVLWHNRAARR